MHAGESHAIQHLFAASYGELKRIAHARIYAANAHDRYATESLLHESYMRLCHQTSLDLPDRKRFYALASKVMRNLVLQEIRDANAQKRGGGQTQVTLATDLVDSCAQDFDVESIDAALRALEQLHPDWAQLVEMRFYGGMTEPEIADALGVSERTVRREWQKARAALIVLLEG